MRANDQKMRSRDVERGARRVRNKDREVIDGANRERGRAQGRVRYSERSWVLVVHCKAISRVVRERERGLGKGEGNYKRTGQGGG